MEVISPAQTVDLRPARSPVTVQLVEDGDLPLWDAFVESHPDASPYHRSVWKHILQAALKKPWFLVGVYQDGRIIGGLPLVHMRSRLTGNFLVSVPYVNYGGLLVENESLANPILEFTRSIASRLKADHIECRHLKNHFSQLPVRQDKVSMWLQLPDSSQELMKSFKPKLRSQIRKGEKNGLEVRIGHIELLEDFYDVFSKNMRDLGTPVYGKEFFRLILQAFPDSGRLVIIFGKDRLPIAAAFLLGYRDRMEIPWASSIRKYNYLQSNMLLYWHCLKYACDQGYGIFDFGRSTVGSSTLKFKEQWGSQPVQHYWHYVLDGKDQLPQINPQNPKYHLAIIIWQRLPLWVTRLVGPSISKHLP